jgi:hypothetical protein
MFWTLVALIAAVMTSSVTGQLTLLEGCKLLELTVPTIQLFEGATECIPPLIDVDVCLGTCLNLLGKKRLPTAKQVNAKCKFAEDATLVDVSVSLLSLGDCE